jgi:hypothetical protein
MQRQGIQIVMSNEIDPFTRHEALHMSLFLAESVEGQLVANDWVESDPKALKMAEKISELLHDLYQYIGSQHFED